MSSRNGLELDPAFEERFALLRLLGRGGMGSVFLAEERALGRKVAIKFLHLALAEEDELAQKRFLEEGRIAAALRHPNVVQVFDSGISGRQLFLVYEYVEGQSLQDLLDDEGGGALPTSFVLRVGIAVSEGLAAAHDLGIVHRDVKPDNVLVASDLALDASGEDFSSIKVSDFGIAKMRGREAAVRTKTGIIIGTPTYMSPEQCRGERPGPSTDVYALGAMLYHCLAGRPPYVGKDMEVLLGHVKGGMRPLRELAPDLPAGLAELVQSALVLDPQRRCPSTAVLGRGLRNLLQGKGALGIAGADATQAQVSSIRRAPRHSRPTQLRLESPSREGRSPDTAELKAAQAPPRSWRPLLAGALLVLPCLVAFAIWIRRPLPMARASKIMLELQRKERRSILSWQSAESYRGHALWAGSAVTGRGARDGREHRVEWSEDNRDGRLLRFGPPGTPASCWIAPPPPNLEAWEVEELDDGQLVVSFPGIVGRCPRLRLKGEDGVERILDLEGSPPRIALEAKWIAEPRSVEAMSWTTRYLENSETLGQEALEVRVSGIARELPGSSAMAGAFVKAFHGHEAAMGWRKKALACLEDDMVGYEIFMDGPEALPWDSEACRRAVTFLERNGELGRSLLTHPALPADLRERFRETLFPLRVIAEFVRRYHRVQTRPLPATVTAFLRACTRLFPEGAMGTLVTPTGEGPATGTIVFEAPNTNRAIFATCNGQFDKAFSDQEINRGGRMGFGVTDGAQEHIDKGLRRMSQPISDLDFYHRLATSPFNLELLRRSLVKALVGAEDAKRLRACGLFEETIAVAADLLAQRRSPFSSRGFEAGDEVLFEAVKRSLRRDRFLPAFARSVASFMQQKASARSPREETRAIVNFVGERWNISVPRLYDLMMRGARNTRPLFLNPMNLDTPRHEQSLVFEVPPCQPGTELTFTLEVYGLHHGQFYLLVLPTRSGERHLPFFNEGDYYVRDDQWFYAYLQKAPAADQEPRALPLPGREKRHRLSARLPADLFLPGRNDGRLRLVNVTRGVGSPTTSFLLSASVRFAPKR